MNINRENSVCLLVTKVQNRLKDKNSLTEAEAGIRGLYQAQPGLLQGVTVKMFVRWFNVGYCGEKTHSELLCPYFWDVIAGGEKVFWCHGAPQWRLH